MKIVSFHWPDTHYPVELVNVKNRTVLDLGCGSFGYIYQNIDKSTVEWWFNLGAQKVIGLDINKDDIETLKKRIIPDPPDRILFLNEGVNHSYQLKKLFADYKPDVVKCDVEGAEIHLLNMNDADFSIAKEYYIETHDFDVRDPKLLILYNAAMEKFERCGYKIREVYEWRHGGHGQGDGSNDIYGVRLIFAFKE
jgi:SAM-dependent methyltransferase